MHKNTIMPCCHIAPDYLLSDAVIPTGIVSEGSQVNGHGVAGFDKAFRRTTRLKTPRTRPSAVIHIFLRPLVSVCFFCRRRLQVRVPNLGKG